MKQLLALVLATGMVAGCSSATSQAEPGGSPQPAPPATMSLLPKDTELRVQLNDTLSSEHSRIGDRFTVTVLEPVLTVDGKAAVPAGALITGLVTGVDDSDHVGDEAFIRLNLVRLSMDKTNQPFAADIVNTNLSVSRPTDAQSAAAGAAAGAVGAILTGDLKKAAEAARLGAGAGSVISLGSSGREVILPPGVIFLIRTTANIALERQ